MADSPKNFLIVPHLAPVAILSGLADSTSQQESSRATRYQVPLLTGTPSSMSDSLRTSKFPLALRGGHLSNLACPLPLNVHEATDFPPGLNLPLLPSPSPHLVCV